jgi:hypothetical protein
MLYGNSKIKNTEDSDTSNTSMILDNNSVKIIQNISISCYNTPKKDSIFKENIQNIVTNRTEVKSNTLNF